MPEMPSYREVVWNFHDWLDRMQQGAADELGVDRKEVYQKEFLSPRHILDALGGFIMDLTLDKPRSFVVTSDTDPSKAYDMNVYPKIGITCSCPGFIYRNKCKHQERVRQFIDGAISAEQAGIASVKES